MATSTRLAVASQDFFANNTLVKSTELGTADDQHDLCMAMMQGKPVSKLEGQHFQAALTHCAIKPGHTYCLEGVF